MLNLQTIINNMEIIEVQPSKLGFKVPTQQLQRFTVTNLTLRSVCICIVSAQPLFTSIHPSSLLLQPFQEQEVEAMVHWNQQLVSGHRSKIRIYVWEMYDEWPIEQILPKMFNKEEEAGCLMFEELLLEIQLDKKCLQGTSAPEPISKYLIQRISLPNKDDVQVSQTMVNKLLEHCEKLGKVKAIYTFASEFIVEFVDVPEPICSFFEARDIHENMALYSIGQVLSTGITFNVSDMVILGDINASSKSSLKEKITRKLGISQENPGSSENSSTIPTHFLAAKANRNIMKQSFIMAETKTRKRNRSEDKTKTFEDEFVFHPNSAIEAEMLQSMRMAVDYEACLPKKKQFYEVNVETTKPILNIASDGRTIYVLMRDCLMIYPIHSLNSKQIIKFDALAEQSIKNRTPMLVCRDDAIFANDCYLYWVNLKSKESEWKYVQRKTIYCICPIDELGLLVVGGKTFSKLSYLGKSTSRTNFKIYSNGQSDKHSHLHTFEIPNCQAESVCELKHISTKPTNTKLLLTLTDHGKMFFFRVKAYNDIELYSRVETHEIGIQSIVSLKYHAETGVLMLLEELAPKHLCFKLLKLKCSYEKVELGTQSVRLPVSNYREEFQLGEEEGCGWMLVIEKKKDERVIWKMMLDDKDPVQVLKGKNIRRCFLSGENLVCQEKTGMKFHLLKD